MQQSLHQTARERDVLSRYVHKEGRQVMEFLWGFKEFGSGWELVSMCLATCLIFLCFRQQSKEVFQYLGIFKVKASVQTCREKHAAGQDTKQSRHSVFLSQRIKLKVDLLKVTDTCFVAISMVNATCALGKNVFRYHVL